jgi:epoxyqueuosine reductase
MMEFISPEFLDELGVTMWSYTEESKPISFDRYEEWVASGDHGPLTYLEDHRKEIRRSLTEFFPEFQSALVFAFSYAEESKALETLYTNNARWNGMKISSYVFGFDKKDYHDVLKARLEIVSAKIKEQFPDIQIKLGLDIHPILERDLAYRTGLGWFGKNSMLIHPKHGSFFILGSLLLSKKLELESKKNETDHCGTCTACIEACPTDAIDGANRRIIANKCISTFTIELFKESEAPQGMEKADGEIFGCDICQDVCPWNIKIIDSLPIKKYEPDLIKDFFLTRKLSEVLKDIEGMSNRGFKKYFDRTPLARTGRIGLLKNIKFWE